MDNQQPPFIGSPGAELRASDADRERAADLLRHHHLEGRLDASEFQERLEQCLQARTLRELATLSADLPEDDSQRARWAVPSVRRLGVWRLAIAATVLTALIAASALAERPLFFPAVPLLFFWLRGFWWHGGRSRRSPPAAQPGRVL